MSCKENRSIKVLRDGLVFCDYRKLLRLDVFDPFEFFLAKGESVLGAVGFSLGKITIVGVFKF